MKIEGRTSGSIKRPLCELCMTQKDEKANSKESDLGLLRNIGQREGGEQAEMHGLRCC